MRLLIFTLSVGFFIWLPSAVADSGGGLSVDAPAHLRQVQNSDNALLTLTVKNIQVHADWHVTSDGDVFTINNDGVLRRKVLATGRHVAKVYAVDRFDRLNANYANLTASAVITVEFVLGTELYFADAPSQLFARARLPEAVTLYQFTGTLGMEAYTYKLVGGDEENFALGATSGVLSLPSNSDMRGGTYYLRVELSDSVPNQATAVVRVNVVPNQVYVMGGISPAPVNDVWESTDAETWTRKVQNAEWPERYNLQVVTHNGRMYLIGGYTNARDNDVWSSVDGKSWSFVANADWPQRDLHQAISHNGRMYVMGGDIGSSFLNDVWSSPDGSSWSQENANVAWRKRNSFQVVLHNSRMYVLGGNDGDTFLNDVWSSLDGSSWSLENADVAWQQRRGFHALSHNGRLYVMGGLSNNKSALNDVWSSADNGKSWVQEKANNNVGWSKRVAFQVISRAGIMYLIGGADSGSLLRASRLKDVWSSADGASWTKIPDPSWAGRSHFQALVFPPPLVLSGTSEVIILSEGTAKTGIATVTAQHGLGEYTYSLESGSRSGIYLNNSSSGVLSYNGNGSKGEYLVTVRVEDEDKLQAKTIIRVKIE